MSHATPPSRKAITLSDNLFLYTDTLPGSGQAHAHDHSHDVESNGHGPNPQSRLDGIIGFLQEQFGPDSVSLITTPKLPPLPVRELQTRPVKKSEDDEDGDKTMGGNEGPGGSDDGDLNAVKAEDDEAEDDMEARTQAELARLQAIGIPVPGIAVKVDRMEAKLWLEDFEIECGHKALADRIRAIVERACDMMDPIWE